MTNAATFGQQAETYAHARPGYPDALYDWIAANSPACESVWDAGTGSGQAARDLAARFSRVHATDNSAAMIAQAEPHSRIGYHVADARASGLPEASVDAICAATAVHWFAEPDFWAEVERVGKPGALFCAWTYQLPRIVTDGGDDFLPRVLELIDPYWADGNRICQAGYSAANLHCPLPVIETPDFNASVRWQARQLAGFVRSWSAHLRARRDGLEAELAALEADFLRAHGEVLLRVQLPISAFGARLSASLRRAGTAAPGLGRGF